MAKKIVTKKAAPVKSVAKSKPKAAVKAKPVKLKAKVVPVKPPIAPRGFSKTELAHFRELIGEKRKEILDELETLKSSMMDVQTGEYVSENSTYSLHMEQGTDTMEREKTFLFASREGKFLNYLDDALKRIDKGVYGFCTDCGSLIDKERLEAVPHAQLCIKCKMKRGR
jgi:DnaK suppressor protein